MGSACAEERILTQCVDWQMPVTACYVTLDIDRDRMNYSHRSGKVLTERGRIYILGAYTGIILGMGSANERRRYIVTTCLIG